MSRCTHDKQEIVEEPGIQVADIVSGRDLASPPAGRPTSPVGEVGTDTHSLLSADVNVLPDLLRRQVADKRNSVLAIVVGLVHQVEPIHEHRQPEQDPHRGQHQ